MDRVTCLTGSGSPYLLKAATSPINWWGWCKEAFELARNWNRPILVDVGASWCHWCNVMDEETYNDQEIAQIINDNFIPIKVDRDERPDIDKKLQSISISISGQAGWPLTVFLTPSGEAIFAGTYFPPRDSLGLPGMPRVLKAVLQAHREGNAIKLDLTTAEEAAPHVNVSVINGVLLGIMEMYDEEHGGFGSFPKFPQVTFHSILLYRGFYSNSSFIDAVNHTLEAMGRGGIHDQLGGGFHRYSVDNAWLLPHFEKLLIDNAELLINYSEAFAVTGNQYLREVAMDTLNYINSVLGDNDGGYYSSQSADSGGEEGGYYKWSIEELASILDQDEFRSIYEYFGLHRFPSGEKAVLHIGKPRMDSSLGTAINKMRSARERREPPVIDETIYVHSTAAAAIAGLAASDYVGAMAINRALKAIDFLESRLIIDGVARRGARNGNRLGPGYLDDQAYALLSLLSAFQHTGNRRYLESAIACGRGLREFLDDSGMLRYASPVASDSDLIQIQVSPLGDSPNWSPGAVAIIAMDTLSRIINGIPSSDAEKSIRAMHGAAARLGPYAASYFIALENHFLDPPKIVIVGHDEAIFKALHEAALSVFRPGKLVIPVLGDSISDLIRDEAVMAMIRAGNTAAYVCAYNECSLPTSDPNSLRQLIMNFARDKYVFIY
jgi:uncharacterized protein YyaL (SSP411 family)